MYKVKYFFFVNNLYKRPFVILKWAETNDGFINNNNSGILEISSDEMKIKITNGEVK